MANEKTLNEIAAQLWGTLWAEGEFPFLTGTNENLNTFQLGFLQGVAHYAELASKMLTETSQT